MRKKIAVLNTVFFELSETFVYHQVCSANHVFNIILVGRELVNASVYPLAGVHFYPVRSRDNFFWRNLIKLKRRLGSEVLLHHAEATDIRRILQEQKPDLVHVHFGHLAVRVLPIIKSLGIPMIVSFHGVDASKKIYRQPAYMHHLPELLAYVTRAIIVSEHMKETLGMDEATERKVVMLPYSIDVHEFSASSSCGGDVVRILHSGRLVGKKGVDDLIRVFSLLINDHARIHLDILGGGELEPSLKSLVAELGLSNYVTFYGRQPHSKVRELMDLADIFVLNSRVADDGDMEGLPVTLLEAMSMEKAIVTTRHAGIPYAITHEHDGLLVGERDNEQLRQSIKRLVADPSLRKKLGEAARQTVVKRFNRDLLKDQLISIYTESIG